MNPKQFLILGGIVLVLVGILGYIGVIGPTPEVSLFGSTWWFDNYENVVHFLLGVVALIAAVALPHSLQKPLVIIVGLVALFFAYWSAVVDTNFYGANLESPADTVLHLVVGVWALAAGLMKDRSMSM